MLVDKPAGMTSHDVVAVVRRVCGTRRVGHTGTLDPMATGLLVVLVGRSTRLADFVPGEPKAYDATIAFGYETTTDDAAGESRRTSGYRPTMEEIRNATLSLTGEIAQLPPEYSAKQVAGRRAYAAARDGAPLQLQPASVRVDGWLLDEFNDGLLRARITCGRGTYIRALARDLGRATRSAAHLVALRRTRSGPFSVADAATVESLRQSVPSLLSSRTLLGHLPQVALSEAEAESVRQGRTITAHACGDRAALVDPSGDLLAVAERAESDHWQPRVVLTGA